MAIQYITVLVTSSGGKSELAKQAQSHSAPSAYLRLSHTFTKTLFLFVQSH